MAVRKIQIRRDTSSAWSTNNPVLDSGELGLDLTTGRIKVGDGSSTWQNLDYLHTLWDTVDNKPTEFPPEYHEHPIVEINGLQDALDTKSNLDGGNTFTGNQEFQDTVTIQGYLTLGTQATNLNHAVRAERRISAGTGMTVNNNGYLTADLTLGIDDGGVDTLQLADGSVTDVKIDTMSASKVTGIVAVENGGTGNATFTEDYFLAGGGGNSPLKEKSPAQVLSEINAPSADDVVYLTGNQTIMGEKTFGNDLHTNGDILTSGNIYSSEENFKVGTSGASVRLNGTTHPTEPNAGRLSNENGQDALTWLGTRVTLTEQAVSTTEPVRADRTIITNDGIIGGGDLTSNLTLSVDNTVVRTTRVVTAGSGLNGGGSLENDITIGVATGGITSTHIAPGSINDSHINAIIPVSKGGTGRNSLTTNYFLTGNGTNGVQTISPTTALTQIGAVPLTQKAAAGGVATLDSTSKIPLNQIPDSIIGGLSYKGTWNADTNTPDILGTTPMSGDFYKVSIAGSTDVDGVTDWGVGDWVIYNGDHWDKLDQTESVSAVAGKTGIVEIFMEDLSNVDNTTAPTTGDLLSWNGSAWEPVAMDGGGA